MSTRPTAPSGGPPSSPQGAPPTTVSTDRHAPASGDSAFAEAGPAGSGPVKSGPVAPGHTAQRGPGEASQSEAPVPAERCQEWYLQRYQQIRGFSNRLCEPLTTEDYVIQTMPEVSPTKWHLAHTSWFFETFLLKRAVRDYRPLDPQFEYLFNSYYNTVGEQYCRPLRGMLSRPTVKDIQHYRDHVDHHMGALLARLDESDDAAELRSIIEIGLHHEQQHQELMLTDIKHIFAANVLRATYGGTMPVESITAPPLNWFTYAEGLTEIGHGGEGFAYDNETPRHRVFLESFALASRLITCGEYLEFIRSGGYENPEWWLSEGWKRVTDESWEGPLYWEREGDEWFIFTLAGKRPIQSHEPVCHVSFYEADAYARWSGHRLPREAEWERAASLAAQEYDLLAAGNFVEDGHFHPVTPRRPSGRPPEQHPAQLLGDAWEWTGSPYAPYPRYQPPTGAMGEYNSKFMCNQMILRGGSCATSRTHIRPTYRNFFPPEARWQFTGIRLAKDT